VALLSLTVGTVYTTAPRIMHYHQEVLGVSWEDVRPREQLLLLALMRGVGLCGLVAGVAMGVLLLVPFRRGERWAAWALPGLGLMTTVPPAYHAVVLAAWTGASTPWPVLPVPIALV